MKTAFFSLEEWQRSYLKGAPIFSSLGEVHLSEACLSEGSLPEERGYTALSVFVSDDVTHKVLDAFPSLEFIATRSTGFDHVDLDACRERGIVVSNVPAYGKETVAEYAFALLISVSRKIPQAYDQVRETGSFDQKPLRGFDLFGKTIGIVGTGKIGRHMIRLCQGFGLNVIACDPHPAADLVGGGIKYMELDEMLPLCDIVSLHAPYTKNNHHLINKDNIGLMKEGSVLINTARGGLVETEALVEALKSGHLSGAGLDVLEEEGVIRDELAFLSTGHPKDADLKTVLAGHALIDMPNVIVTPHNAFNTKEALERILATTLENLSNFAKGSPGNTI